jgi:hypothetical protein
MSDRAAQRAGFLPGAAVGAAVAVLAMLLVEPTAGGAAGNGAALGQWLSLNLGHSSWLFGAVLVLFVVHLTRLRRRLDSPPALGAAEDTAGFRRAIAELDQLTDVWIHLFIGIGVVWTAVGMRSALQVALADPDHALTDSAGSVLKKLVDGGILLALSTTIVGAVGGYLMRLGKTLYTGAALHDHYDAQERSDLRELVSTVQRLERRVDGRTGEAGADATQ